MKATLLPYSVSAATTMPITAFNSSSHIGEPLKPGSTRWPGPLVSSICIQPLAVSARSTPEAQTPLSKEAGKPKALKPWPHRSPPYPFVRIMLWAPSGNWLSNSRPAISSSLSGLQDIIWALRILGVFPGFKRGKSRWIHDSGILGLSTTPRASEITWAQVKIVLLSIRNPKPTIEPSSFPILTIEPSSGCDIKSTPFSM